MDFSSNMVFPPEITHHIFHYLTPKELCKAGEVSKDWYAIQNSNDLWKRLCRESFHEQGRKPYKDSWKKRFIILSNWKQGKSVSSVYKRIGYSDIFIIKEKCYTIQNVGLKRVIQNLSDKKIVIINPEEYIKKPEITSRHVYKETAFYTDIEETILCFNIPKGVFLYKIETPSQDKVRSHMIACNGKNIFIYHAYKSRTEPEEIKMYDRKTGQMKDKIPLSDKYGKINDLVCSSQQILCASSQNVFEINIIDKTISLLFEASSHSKIKSIKISDQYIVILDKAEGIIIFKNVKYDGLKSVHKKIKETDVYQIKIVNNWLFVNKMISKFSVYDMETGEPIVFPYFDQSCITEFQSDGNQLVLTYNLFDRSSFHKVFDFRPENIRNPSLK